MYYSARSRWTNNNNNIVVYYVLLITLLFSFQIQFGMIALHSFPLLLIREVKYPRILGVLIFTQSIIMSFLFYDFYRKAYLKKKVK